MAAQPYSRLDIDSELLIDLVKSRPAIYDRSIKDYNNREYKTELWIEITSILFSDIWKDLSDEQKEFKASEVLKRWNNIRTSFTRELKIMRDPSSTKHRKYLYFDKLLYLVDVTTDHVFESTEKLNDSSDQEERPKKFCLLRKPLSRVKKKHKDTKEVEERKVRKKKREKEQQKREKGEQTIDSREVEKNPKYDDGDTNFALSLIPTLKKIPFDKKIDAQIEILSVLKKYSKDVTVEHCNNIVIKCERADPLSSESDDSQDVLSADDDCN